MYDSSCHLNGNIMRNNLRSGLIICGSSFPKVENNELFGNTTAGVMIRGSSEAIMSKNKIHENYYQVSIKGMSSKRTKRVIDSNTIDGPCEIPNKFCPIF